MALGVICITKRIKRNITAIANIVFTIKDKYILLIGNKQCCITITTNNIKALIDGLIK